jgi:hypothetical protein
MVSRELGTLIHDRYPANPDATDYLNQLRHLRDSAT